MHVRPGATAWAEDFLRGGSAMEQFTPSYLEPAIYRMRTSWGLPWDDGQYRDWSHRSTVTFSLPITSPPQSLVEWGFVPMGESQQRNARLAFELWDDVIALDLNETAGWSGDIVFSYRSRTPDDGYTGTSLDELTFGTHLDRAYVQIHSALPWTNDDADFFFGSWGFTTYLHEIGHSLGLSHPGRYNSDHATWANDAEFPEDTLRYTVMSYFEADADGSGTDHVRANGQRSYAAAPLLYDIAAPQAICGADMTTRTGNPIYGFNST